MTQLMVRTTGPHPRFELQAATWPALPVRQILLPSVGLWAAGHDDEGPLSALHTIWESFSNEPEVEYDPARPAEGVQVVERSSVPPEPGKIRMTLVHSASSLGPKLVAMTSRDALVFQARTKSLRLVPELFFPSASSFHADPTPPPGISSTMTVQVVDAATGNPLRGARVTVVVDLSLNHGDVAFTDGSGHAVLQIGTPPVRVEHIYVQPPPSGYWGAYEAPSALAVGPWLIGLHPVDITIADCVRDIYPCGYGDGAGVRVGIIDNGIDHPEVSVIGGRNTVVREPDVDYGDNGGDGHGTHLAGIVSAAGPVLRGIAPAAEIASYRVFGQGDDKASNYSIILAANQALQDGCHVLNLSIGGLVATPELKDMDDDIAERGAVCFAASGNTNRGAVTCPAAFVNMLAVSAMGRSRNLPAGVLEEADIDRPPVGTDPDDFIAAFSGVTGAGIDFVAPGVGVVSTVPGGGYRPWSGTSQACAAATGAAARRLSGESVLHQVADRARSDHIKNLLIGSVVSMGFGPVYEGNGLIDL
jgi:subtilisin